MRRLLFVLASVIAVLTFSCDTTQPDFDDSVPGVNTLTTSVSPTGAGEVFPSEGEFVEGTTIEIEAVPNIGFTFNRWEGDLVGSLNPTFLSMSANRSVTALFAEIEVPLTINIEGEGTVEQEILEQTQTAVTATLKVPTSEPEPEDSLELKPSTGSQVPQKDAGRKIEGSGNPTRSQLDRGEQRPSISDEQVEQTQVQQLRAQGQARKAITTLRLTAVPDDGWQFSRWEGALSGSQNPDTLVVEEETVLTAVFEQDASELFTLELIVEGQGFIEAVPDKLEYTAGEEVSLSATADSGWEFSEWQGDLSGNQNPETIIMNSDKQISSIFSREGAPQAEIVNQPSRTVAGEFISPAPSVRFTNADSEPVAGIDIEANLSINSFTGISGTTVTTDSDGVARFDQLAIETVGDSYTISFEALGTNAAVIISSQFEIIAAEGDPAASSASAANGIAGEPTVINISIVDRFGNPVTGVAEELDVAVSGANNATPSVNEGQEAGQYSAEYTPQNIGTDQIRVSLSGTSIIENPIESVVTASDISGENSLAEISTNELRVGQEATLTVTVRDAQNNPLSGIANEIQVSGAGGASVGTFTENGQTGVYTAGVISTIPGEISLTVSVSGVTLEPALVIAFLTGSAETIEIVSGNNQSAIVASELPNPVVVRVTDAFDNPVDGETVTFEFDETPPAAVGRSVEPGSVETNTDGEASAAVTLGIVPGTYTINASSENAGSVTFNLQATIGQASAISILSQPVATTAGESISPSPSVEITDDEGNGIEGVEITAELNGGSFSNESILQVSTNSAGIAEFGNLIVTNAGSDYSVTFNSSSSSIGDVTSDSFSITSASPDPVNSTADVPNGSAGDQTDITITLQDEFGNPVEGAASALTLAINEGENTGAAFTSVSDVGNGTYQTGYTPSLIGTDLISIQLNGTAIEGSPFPSEVITTDAEDVSLTQQPQNSVAGDVIGGNPSVLVIDNNQNPVADVEVTVSADGPGTIAGGSLTASTNVAGIAVFDDLVIEVSGSYNLRFNALGVSEVAVSDQFTVSSAAANALIEVSGDGQTATVNEELGSPFIVRSQDAFGNPVAGETVEFTIQDLPNGASGQSLSSETVSTGDDGVAATTLSLGDSVGRYSVTASAGVGDVVFSATALPASAQTFVFDEISSPKTAGSSFLISITAFDEFDNVATGYNGTASLSTTAGSVNPNSISFKDGEATQSINVTGAGSNQSITATDGSISGISNEFDVQTGGATRAEIIQQPTNTAGGQAISPSPAVEVTDAQGNPVSGVNVEANLSSKSFASGSTTQTTNNSGVAVFGNLLIEQAGSYTIVFDVLASGVNDPESSQFVITPAGADPQNTDASVPNGVAGEETTILITAEDAFGNRVDGIASELAISISGANSASPSAEPAGSGQYQAVYLPSSSGTDQVVIELNGAPISRSPYSSSVSTSDISSSESSVTVNPETVQAGSSSQVVVQLRDGSGNSISGLGNSDFSINVSGNGNAGSVSESSTGTYQFNVRNTTAQQVTVSVNANGVTLDDTPQITFTAADPDLIAIPSGSQPGTSIAGEIITNTPSVRVLDEFGNSVPNIDVAVSELGGQSFASGSEIRTTNSSGIVEFGDLVIDQAGEYRLDFLAQGGLSTTSQSFVVEPAEADAGNSTANVPNGSAGDQTNITITVRDAFGNRVEGVASDLSVLVSGANSGATAASVSDDGNGVYATSYTPTANGTDQVTIELNETGIQGSPFTSNVITSDAANVEMSTQPGTTTAGNPIAGPPSVLVTDDQNNSVEGVEVIVSANGTGSIVDGATSVNTNSSGVAEFSDLVIETTGSYTLEFNAIGVSENAISDPFEVEPAEASQVNRVAGNNQSAIVTEQLNDPFVVRITDNFGNSVQGHTVQFEIDQSPAGASGEQLSSTSGNTDADGFVSTLLTIGNIAGTYTVSVNAGSAGTTSFTATAVAGAAATFVFDQVSGPQTAGQPFGIVIAALDDEGNTARGYNGTASLSTTAGSITPSAADFINGTASLDVSVSNAGTGQTISAEDGSVTGTSNTFDVQSGGVDSAASSVSADPTTLQAGQSSTLTIDLRDGSNNLVGGLSDTDFTLSLSGSALIQGNVTETPTFGIYEASIYNETAETITATITASGTTLNDTPQVEFTPADADGLVLVSGNNQSGTVTQQLDDPFVVRVEDQFENPVSGKTVEFAINQTPPASIGEGLSNVQVQTNNTGEASTLLTLGTTPGTYTVDATTAGLNVVTFSAEALIGSASQMTIETEPGDTRAGQSISPAPQVQITDAAGNPLQGISVTVSEQDGYIFDGGTLTQLTNTAGVATFGNLVIQSSGRYALVFNASASGVPNVTSSRFNVNPGVGDAGSSTLDVPDGTAGEETEIKIKVEDEFGNAVDDAERDLFVSVTGANTVSPAVSFTGEAGEYASFYTPLNSGDDTVEATLSGIELSNSSQISSISASGVSASESIASANPNVLQVGNESTVTIEVKDGSGNAIAGLGGSEFLIDVSGEGTADPVNETNVSGIYEFNVGNTTAQTVTVTAIVSGVTLEDTPQIEFTPGDANRMAFSTQPDNAVAGQPISGPPTVFLEDEFSNPVPGVEVTVTEQGGQSLESGTQIVSTNASGEAGFSDLVITSAGEYNLVFSANGVTTLTSNAFSILPANADPAFTTANVPNGAATSQTEITITVEDPFGNRVTGVAGDLAVSVGGTNSGSPIDPISDVGNGIYSTGYTPSTVGTDEITITLGGVGIAGSPYESVVTTSDAENVVVEVEPLQTVAGQPVAGPPAARVTDAGNNNVPGVEVIAGLQSGAFDSGTTSVNTDGSGIATFSDLVINTAGSYVMEFNAVGVSSDAISQAFDVVAAAASNLAIDSGNNQTGTVTQSVADPFVVQVTDTFGNPVEGTEVSFNITGNPLDATGQALTTLVAETDANGLLSTELTLGNRPGTYEVTASSDGLTDVTFTATAEAGPATAYEFDTVSSPQTAGQPFTISLTALDDQGNIAVSYGETVTFSASQGTITPASAEFTNGTVSLNASIDQAGSGITITATDGAISETSNAFDVQTGGVDAANSSVSANPLTLQAGNNSTLTIELRDGSENLVGGLTDADFTISLDGNATAGTVSESTEGIYTADITNQTAETVTATVTARGIPLNETPQIEFIPADADPAATTANVPNGAAGDATAVTISVVDEFGNAVIGVDAALSIDVTAGPNDDESFTGITDNSDGTYTASYTPQTIGTDEITITLNSIEIFGSPYSSNVTNSEVSASNSSVTANPTNLIVGNTSTVTVVLRDGSDNPIAGLLSSDFDIAPTGSASASTVNETATLGTYQFTVSNQVAESVTVSITATGTTLQDSPSISFTAADPSIITVSTQPGNIDAGQTIAGPPTVTLEDEFDNPVPNIDVTVSEQGGQTFVSGTLTVQTDASGTADFSDLVITEEGQYNLVFNEPGGKSATSNVFGVNPAAADAAQTTATVPNGAVGESTDITIIVSDAFGNRVEGVAGVLSATVFGANNEETLNITEISNGEYSTSYSPTNTGDDTVTIDLDGTAIQGSPFTSTVITSNADAVSVDTQPQQTVAGEPIAGPPAAFVIDSETNPVPNIDVVVSLQSGSFTGGTETVTTNTSGISEFTDLVITQAGSYVMEFNAQGVADPAASNSFNVVAAAASDIAIESGNNQTAIVTETLADPFVVQVTDVFGNPVENETVEFAVTDEPASATGQGLTLSSTTTDGNGFASTTLTLGNISGDYQVTATSGALTPVVFTATANAGPAASYTLDAISSPQTAGEAFTISLTAEDSEGNLADGYSGTASLSTTAGTIDPASADFTSGAATVNVTVSDAGTGQTITAEDGAITGTSNTFDVQTGGVDAVNSSVAASPITLQAGQNSALTIELRDGSNNVVGGLTDADFTISLDGNATAGTVSEPTEGIYTADVTNQTAETVTATITASGIQLDDQPQIDFTPADADPAATTANVPNGAAGDATAITISVADEFGNAVTGIEAQLAASITTGPNVGETFSAINGNSDGTYTTSYTPQAIGDDEITITLNSVEISGSPFTSTVTTSDVSASNSSATANPTSLVVGNASTVTVVLEDGSNNPNCRALSV